jgi:hypothetical protein
MAFCDSFVNTHGFTGHRSIRKVGPASSLSPSRRPFQMSPGLGSTVDFLGKVSFFEWANMVQIISNYLIITFFAKGINHGHIMDKSWINHG